MNDELLTRRKDGEEARSLLEHPLFRAAFDRVAADLEQVALSCSPDDTAKAQRIILSKQLLAAVKQEIVRVVEDGDMATFAMREAESKKGLLRFLR